VCELGSIEVKYGDRQGSILGPLSFIVHVGDMPQFLGVEDMDVVVVYADDTTI
jgi:hypothetical protein